MFDNEEIDKIVSVLQNGGVAILPTDTVWGVCCAAFNEDVVRKITKNQDRSTSIGPILLVADAAHLGEYITKIHPKAQGLLDYHVRPLTIVYHHLKNIPVYLLNADGAVAVRIVQDPFCQQIIQRLGGPLLMDVASLPGEAPPGNYSQIAKDLLAQSDYVAQHRRGEQATHLPSVVVQVDEEGNLEFLRK